MALWQENRHGSLVICVEGYSVLGFPSSRSQIFLISFDRCASVYVYVPFSFPFR
ncbi:hypothetical protein L210DRAFT_3558350, partial [Boletus edulis BED1]